MAEQNLLTIHAFAKMCRTTVRTLRFYDKLGLLAPVRIDEWTHYRYYSPFQTRDFFRIRLLQTFDVPLKEVKIAKSQQYLKKKIAQVRQELEEKQKEYNFLNTIDDFFFGKIDLKKVLKKESIGPFTLFGAYFPQGAYHSITPDIVRVENMAKKLGIKTTKSRVIFYLDPDKYKPKDTRLEIMVVCSPRFKRGQKVKNVINPDQIGVKPPQGYFFREFPKTTGYSFSYLGPADFITLVYERLHEQNILKKLPIEEYPIDYEVYGPPESKSVYDHLTKIIFPLKSLNK